MADPKDKSLSGQIFPDAVPASRDAIIRGDSGLAQSRERLFRSTIRESSVIRRPLRRVSELLSDELTSDVFTQKDTRVLVGEQRRLQRSSRRMIRAATLQIENDIEEGVTRAIHRAQLTQESHLQRMGIGRLSAATRREIRELVLEQLEAEFPPGSGKNFRTRMRALGIRHSNQIDNIIARSYSSGGARNRILRGVNEGLTYRGPGRTPVSGGSMFRQSQRVLVAEETRAANLAEVTTLGISGVAFAYWRLSPAHKWYGGQEICEVYASRIQNEVQTELESHRIRVSTSDLEGLCLVRNWPQYPHPYCKCFPEAWVPPQLLGVQPPTAIRPPTEVQPPPEIPFGLPPTAARLPTAVRPPTEVRLPFGLPPTRIEITVTFEEFLRRSANEYISALIAAGILLSTASGLEPSEQRSIEE